MKPRHGHRTATVSWGGASRVRRFLETPFWWPGDRRTSHPCRHVHAWEDIQEESTRREPSLPEHQLRETDIELALAERACRYCHLKPSGHIAHNCSLRLHRICIADARKMMRKELLLTSDDKPPLLQAQYDHYCEAIIQGVRQDFKSVNATFQRGYVATSEELVDET